MSSTNNNNTSWLKRWISGDAKAKDVALLEESQQNDPFLRDAMEGYRHFAHSDHEQRLANMRNKLVTQKATANKTKWRVAASIALLLIAATFFFVLNPQEQDIAPTLAEKTAQNKAVQPIEETTQFSDVKVHANNRKTPETSLPKKIKKQATPTKEKKVDIAKNEAPAPIKKNKEAAPLEETTTLDDNFGEEPAVATTKRKKATPATIEKITIGENILETDDDDTQYIIGRIKDIDDWPLAGVTIFSKDGQLVTSDKSGNFTLEWTEQLKSLEVIRDGYQPQLITINEPGAFTITLPEDTTLNEAKTTTPKTDIDRLLLNHLAERDLLTEVDLLQLNVVVDPSGKVIDIIPVGIYPDVFWKVIKNTLLDGPKWNNTTNQNKHIYYELKLRK